MTASRLDLTQLAATLRSTLWYAGCAHRTFTCINACSSMVIISTRMYRSHDERFSGNDIRRSTDADDSMTTPTFGALSLFSWNFRYCVILVEAIV
jgi:hypothetical protein